MTRLLAILAAVLSLTWVSSAFAEEMKVTTTPKTRAATPTTTTHHDGNVTEVTATAWAVRTVGLADLLTTARTANNRAISDNALSARIDVAVVEDFNIERSAGITGFVGEVDVATGVQEVILPTTEIRMMRRNNEEVTDRSGGLRPSVSRATLNQGMRTPNTKEVKGATP